MLWLPFVRRLGAGLDARPDRLHRRPARLPRRSTPRSRASRSPAPAPRPSAGPALVFLGAAGRLPGCWPGSTRSLRGPARARSGAAAPAALYLALLVAIGIGLHNLGEGLAIGSAYATGALALGAFLVVGFAIHNTTEGLAIVAPLARPARSPIRAAASALGLIAGAPAILGAWIGAAAFNPSLAALLLRRRRRRDRPGDRADLARRCATSGRRACSPRRRRRACSPASSSSTLTGLLVISLMAARRTRTPRSRPAPTHRGDRGLREGDLRARRPRAGPGRRRASSPSGWASPPATATAMLKRLDELGLVELRALPGRRA